MLSLRSKVGNDQLSAYVIWIIEHRVHSISLTSLMFKFTEQFHLTKKTKFKSLIFCLSLIRDILIYKICVIYMFKCLNLIIKSTSAQAF